ncbi:MAG TPA: hemolysin family protein [Balneolales bacterium]|nr:hemolysin family protein [Balneolales bacterium]
MSDGLLIVLTILVSAFFSGSEIAFVSANRLKLEIKARQNTLGGRQLSFFIKNPEEFLATTLVGNNIVNVVYATLITIYLVPVVQREYLALTAAVPSSAAVLLIQTIIASFIIMIFGEVIPKALFRANADLLIYLAAVPLKISYWLLKPLIYIAERASQVLVNRIGGDTQNVSRLFRRHDIELLLQELYEEGGSEEIDRDDSEILTNVLKLSSKRVRDSMIPRTEIVAVEKSTDLQDVLKTFISSGFSKLPVYDETIDNIIGVVFAYDLYNNPKSLDEIIHAVKMVPYTQRSKDLLTEFRKSKISLAIVIDEYGGTAGLVTIEDLLEEVVGDIMDEYDTEDEIMKKLNDRTYVISGSVELEELHEKFPEINIQPSNGDFETVAGFIIHEIARIPKVNEEVLIGRYKFIISKATPSRVETVKLIVLDV